MERWKLEPAHDHGLPLADRVKSLRRESGLLETAAHWWWALVTSAYFKAYHRLEVRGREHVPKAPPFVLAANHASHLDALALATALPLRLRDRVFPVAAGDTFFETPVLAAFAAFVLNALPMWRRNCGAHALRELRERLVGEPCGLILFPEGTRSRDGTMGAFRPGLGMLVAGTSVPVVPCRVEGTFEALPPHKRLPRPRKVRVTIGPPMAFDAEGEGRDAWTRVCSSVHEAVAALARLP